MLSVTQIIGLLAILCNAIASFTAMVFCFAMAANASSSQWNWLKLGIAGIAILGLMGISLSVVWMRGGQPIWAMGASMLPVAIYAMVFGVLLLK